MCARRIDLVVSGGALEVPAVPGGGREESVEDDEGEGGGGGEEEEMRAR